MNSETLFARTAPLKLFFLASIPGAVSMLASALYQTLDGVFVGRFLGATAFAAVNLAMPFVIINFSLADLIGVGAAVPIAIALGKKKEKEAHNIFTCACMMIVLAGIGVGGILFAAAPSLIRLMGAEGEFASLAVQYMRVYALCSPVTTIVFAMDNFLRISGLIRGSMFLNLLMSVLSGTLEFLFLGVLGWGVWAAALATCTGMAVCALLAAVALSCFPAQVASLFMAGSGQEVLVMASGALRLFALTFVTRWVSFAMQSYMLAIGKPLPASLISVSTALVFPVLLVALLWPFGLTCSKQKQVSCRGGPNKMKGKQSGRKCP